MKQHSIFIFKEVNDIPVPHLIGIFQNFDTANKVWSNERYCTDNIACIVLTKEKGFYKITRQWSKDKIEHIFDPYIFGPEELNDSPSIESNNEYDCTD